MNITDKITVTNEDCMDLLKRTPDKYYELSIVDVPYGIGESSNNNKGRSKLAKSKDYGKKDWDNFAPNKEYFDELLRVSKNIIIWGANHFIENIPKANSSCWIVWDKDNGYNDFADCELAWTSFDTAVRKFKYKWHGMLQQKMGADKENRIHPTQKPVDLYKWLLDKYAKPNDKILDTHLGSGSIAIAAHDYGFNLTACELDPEYYNTAIKRITNHIGQQKLAF